MSTDVQRISGYIAPTTPFNRTQIDPYHAQIKARNPQVDPCPGRLKYTDENFANKTKQVDPCSGQLKYTDENFANKAKQVDPCSYRPKYTDQDFTNKVK